MTFKLPAVACGFTFLFGTLIAPDAPADGTVYRWVDENGQAVYSQFAAPPGQTAEQVAPPPPPAAALMSSGKPISVAAAARTPGARSRRARTSAGRVFGSPIRPRVIRNAANTRE